MYIEDLENLIRKNIQEMNDLTSKFIRLTDDYETLKNEYNVFLSFVPEELKELSNPFVVLTDKISELSEIIQEIEFFKANMIDFQVQYDTIPIAFDENTQTDIGFSFLKKIVECLHQGLHILGHKEYTQRKTKKPRPL
jgi:hypothetical protein